MLTNLKVIKAKKMIDGTGNTPQEDIAIVIKDNVIQEIISQRNFKNTKDALIIDLEDKTVLPGLIDAHMHFFAVPSHELYRLLTDDEEERVLRAAWEAKKMLMAGITSARCLGSTISPFIKKGIEKGYIEGPRLVVAGQFIISTGGTWQDIMPTDEGADGSDMIRMKVRKRITEGANVIKIGLSKGGNDDINTSWGDDPYQTLTSYSLEEVKSITEEAHGHNIKVSAHCIGDHAVNLAIDGGVDIIEHGYGIMDETRKKLADSQIPVITTISQLASHLACADEYGYTEEEKKVFQSHWEAMKKDFKEGLRAGINFVIGTDLIGYPTHPQDNAAKELELAVEWGMDPADAIVAGTKKGAKILGLEDEVGTIEEGKKADIIAVSDDPLKDITALQKVAFVMKDGDLIKWDK